MRNKFRKSKILYITLFIVLLLGISTTTSLIREVVPGILPGANIKKQEQVITVTRVIDGDTFVSGTNTFRLIGVDTPESVAPQEYRNTKYGKIASKFTEKTLEGQKVKIVFDKGKKDVYGRYLVYVYVGNIFFNNLLIKKGLARTMTIAPNEKYKNKFADTEKKTKSKKIGFFKLNPDKVWIEKKNHNLP